VNYVMKFIRRSGSTTQCKAT